MQTPGFVRAVNSVERDVGNIPSVAGLLLPRRENTTRPLLGTVNELVLKNLLLLVFNMKE